MSTVSLEHVRDTLRKARENLEQDYRARSAAIDEAIKALGDEAVSRPTNGHTDVTDLSIGSDKLKKVRDVLRTSTSGRVRQADITKKSKLNSGTVSVALRKLEANQEVRSTGEKEDGSMVWEEIRPTSVAGQGEHLATAA